MANKKGLFLVIDQLKNNWAKIKKNLFNKNWFRKSLVPKIYSVLSNENKPSGLIEILSVKTQAEMQAEDYKLNKTFCGGQKSLTYANIPNIAGDFQYLITPEIFGILVGVMASDGYITFSGSIQISQTARQYSNYKVFLHLVQTLAPIISSVELYQGDQQKVKFSTPEECIAKMEKIAKQIEQLKKSNVIPLHRHNTAQGQKGTTRTFALRICTYSIFKPWRKDWYSNEKKWPDNILDIYVSPITLATHLMLDGGRKSTSKINNSTFNLGMLCPAIFKAILIQNFGLVGFYHRDGKKNNIIFTIQSDIYFNGRGARNQALFYTLINPFLIPEMQRKVYNVFTPDRVLSVEPYVKGQQKYLPALRVYKKPSSYPYAQYGYEYFDFDAFLCYEGAHRLELTNGDFYMPLEIQKKYITFFSLEWTCKQMY